MFITRVYQRISQWLKQGIHRKLVFWSIVFWIISLSILSLTFLWIGQNEIFNDIKKRNIQIASVVSRDVNSQISTILSDIRIFSHYLESLGADMESQVSTLLTLRLSSPQRYHAAYFFDANNKLLIHLADPLESLLNINDISEIISRPLQPVGSEVLAVSHEANEIGMNVSNVHFIGLEHIPVVYVAVPLNFSPDLSRVIVLQIDMRDIWQHIILNTVGESGYTFAVSPKGEIIAHPDPTYLGRYFSSELKPVLEGYEGFTEYSERYTKRGVYAAYSPVGGPMGWGIVVEQDIFEANAPLVRTIIITGIVWLALAILGTGDILVLMRGFTRPIIKLTKITQEIERTGKLTKTSMEERMDEVGQLSLSFDRMVERVTERTRELEKLEQLGRAIINAPPDASTLPEMLQEYIPNMFPNSRIEIRIFPDQVFLHHPVDYPPVTASVWNWLCTVSDAQYFASGEVPPWDKRPITTGLILAPIIDPERTETIGGIYLSQQREPHLVTSLLPAVQSLAAQIASALHSARDYAQILAHHRVTQELNTAWRIQASFLPDELPQLPGWQLAATLKPARETSGDFYDVVPLPGGRLGIVIADVADKGVGAALYMALTRTLIRTYAVEHESSPDLVLSAVNRRLLMDIHYDMFVTVFFGILDLTTGTLTYCNAGHNPPYLFNANDYSVHALNRTGVALGVVDNLTWTQDTAQLANGDILLLYTDGITEAQNNQGLFFGDRKWLETIQAGKEWSAQEIQDALFREVLEFVGDVSQFDDITLMVVVRGIKK